LFWRDADDKFTYFLSIVTYVLFFLAVFMSLVFLKEIVFGIYHWFLTIQFIWGITLIQEDLPYVLTKWLNKDLFIFQCFPQWASTLSRNFFNSVGAKEGYEITSDKYYDYGIQNYHMIDWFVVYLIIFSII